MMRNITLDIIKLISAFMVVFIHFQFPGNFGDAINASARIAVPLFFMTSGYFCLHNDMEKIIRKALRIFRMYLMSASVYILCRITFGGGINLA